jgi:hypothetical protein
MKKIHIVLLVVCGLYSCSHPDSYTHTITDNSGIDKLAVTYIGPNVEIVAFRGKDSTVQSIHFEGSVELIVVAPEFTLKFPEIAQKYFNMDGHITITKGIYHDYFPSDWSSLKKINNYLTYRFESDKQHFFFIVYSLSTGEDIGSYFEFE